MAQRNARTSLKDFEIPMGSWEQIAQERSKWRGLVNEEAAFYEKKSEAERKRIESKAKTNRSSAGSITLTCSTCNRHFRARIGLVSHQEIMMVFLISERRTTIG